MPDGPSQPMRFGPCGPLRGSVALPGDKSISHRALMIAAIAVGESRIRSLSEGTDVLSTAAALHAMGVPIQSGEGEWLVGGIGLDALRGPSAALDMGNSGTSTRLLMGLVASHGISASFTGDRSLCRRPMDRVIAPLRAIGAEVRASPGERLPLTIRGASAAKPLRYGTSIASAQIKSALLLAGCNIEGETEVLQHPATRNHTEVMLRRFGADLEVEHVGDGARVTLRGPARLRAQNVDVPGDFSAAAFLIVAALIVPDSEVKLTGVGLNPLRTGLLDLLTAIGADIRVENARDQGGEGAGDLLVRHSRLRADAGSAALSPLLIASAIDEFPIFFIAAAFAEGRTEVTGLAELRVKESDRISAMASGLRAIGAQVEESADGLVIQGSAGAPLTGGATIDPALDHRVAMAFAVAGLRCREPVTVADMSPVQTSFPSFAATLAALGAEPTLCR